MPARRCHPEPLIGGHFASIVLSPNHPGPAPCTVAACLPHRSLAAPFAAGRAVTLRRPAGSAPIVPVAAAGASDIVARIMAGCDDAAAHLTPAGMDAIEAAVDRCEEWKTMGELIEPLRQRGHDLLPDGQRNPPSTTSDLRGDHRGCRRPPGTSACARDLVLEHVRFSDWRCTIASTASGVLYQSRRWRSVITAPGSMALTRMLSGPKARAQRPRRGRRWRPLPPRRPAKSPPPLRQAIEARLMIEPWPSSRMCGCTAWAAKK